jgi:two-component system, OmpR family, response regulator
MTRILLIDDDEKLNTLLTQYLGRFGFAVSARSTPEAGLRTLRDDPYDVLVLDVMLPGMDGFAVLRKVRETSRIPIVMLTARGEVTDRIIGLESGADDYLPKPFEPRELVARIQAVLRRHTVGPADEPIRAHGLVIDPATQRVALQGRPLTLTGAEFALLSLLVRHRGRILSRDHIMEETRGIDWEAYDRSIDVLISRLRQKLGDDVKQPAFIRTIRGRGYMFTGGEA